MGQSFSQIVEKKKRELKYEEAFELLRTEQTMRDRLECVRAKLYIDALNDECLPIVCAVDKFYDLLLSVENVEENILKKNLEKHLSGDHLEELTGLMTGVLKSVLTTTTSHEVRQTHVVHANRSVIRIDYFVYFQNSVVGMNALFYYVQVGVIDMARARLPVLIYELTRATKDSKLRDAGDKLKAMAHSTIHLNDAAQTLARAARGERIFSSSDATDAGGGAGTQTTTQRPQDPAAQPMEVS